MQYELFSDTDFQQELPLAGRALCLLGSFRLGSKALKQKLQALGADIRQAPSRNLHYAVVGTDAPADAQQQLQQLAYHGYHIKTLSETDIDQILAGHYSQYSVPEQISKHLHLTLQHYLDSRFSYDGQLNPLYTRELYLPPDLPAHLFQMLGNRGIYANTYIDDTTDVIVISDTTLRHLQEGQPDETLRYIEAQYDKSRTTVFRYTMTSEGELLAWLKHAINSKS